jgi:hypothetical protein
MRSLVLVPFLVLAASGCQQAQAPSSQGSSSSAAVAAASKASPSGASAASPTAAAAPKAASQVAKIVFIDKANACECTTKRIKGSWDALQAALGASPSIPIERIHLDTEPAKAEVYTALEPLMVPPGLYFVDANGAVLELLQGEVTKDQVAAALQKK